jgi:IS30 family transposase
MGHQKRLNELPLSAKNKSRIGCFEGDTILGKGHKSMVFTAIDRKTKISFVHKLKTRDSKGVFEAVKLMKREFGKKFKILILDNGKEFACHKELENEFGITVFFSDPGKPWQRGMNENMNKQLRKNLPKGTDFRFVPWQYIRKQMYLFNNRPKKSLDYKTANEVFNKSKVVAILN